jgi:hypothetical protein
MNGAPRYKTQIPCGNDNKKTKALHTFTESQFSEDETVAKMGTRFIRLCGEDYFSRRR